MKTGGWLALGLCLGSVGCGDDDNKGGSPMGSGGTTPGSGGASSGGAVSSGGTTTGSGGMMPTSGGMGGGGMTGMAGADAGPPVLDPADYASDSNWVCKPGLADNPCDTALSATEIHADGTTTQFDVPAAGDSAVDCFYVYPTVDLGTTAENKDFAAIDRELILDPLLAQAAPLRSICKLYAPLYRQASIGAYLGDAATLEEKLEIAYTDIQAAFEYYEANFAQGRPLLLVGHSQGSMMTTKLIQRMVDMDADLRSRLVATVLAGALGYYQTPTDGMAMGSFQNVPLCTSAEENGCVLTFNTFADGFPPGMGYGGLGGTTVPAGTDVGCTNPAAPAAGAGAAQLSGTFLPTAARQDTFRIPFTFPTTIDTYFAVYRDFFQGECAAAPNGLSYLKIAAAPEAGDTRMNPVPFDDPGLDPNVLGMHILDYSFVSDDLKALLQTKIDAHPGSSGDAGPPGDAGTPVADAAAPDASN